jgi:hypothetical protein
MIEKLAVLAIDKADGSLSLESGEKGEIYQKTRQMIRDLNAKPSHDVLRLRAFYHAGVLKEYKFKANIVAATSAPAVEPEPDETDADAKAVREALKAKGVKVPPRISIDALLKLAIENGVEV